MVLSDIKQRIEAEMTKKGFNETSLAQAAKLGNTAVRDLLKNPDQDPRIGTILKIAKALGVSVNYLLTDDVYGDEKLAIISELSIAVSAGSGTALDQEEVENNWAIPKAYLQPRIQDGLDKLRIIRVQGNSMYPEYNPDDRILIDTACRTPADGDFVIVDGFGNIMVKRLQIVPNGENPRIRVISLNATYQPYELDASEIHINGKVVGKWDWK